MNSFAKFQAKIQAKISQSTAAEAMASRAPNSLEKLTILKRVLTVDIPTISRNKNDRTNFNNADTLLEVFGKFQLQITRELKMWNWLYLHKSKKFNHFPVKIHDVKLDSKSKARIFTLKNLEPSNGNHKMEAVYFGNAVPSIQSGSY